MAEAIRDQLPYGSAFLVYSVHCYVILYNIFNVFEELIHRFSSGGKVTSRAELSDILHASNLSELPVTAVYTVSYWNAASSPSSSFLLCSSK